MTSTIKISAADLGTNTIKVTHATRTLDGELSDMEHASDTIRLGFGIERTGSIEPERIEACLRFLKGEQSKGEEYRSIDFVGVATEALRIASNGPLLMQRIADETDWKIDIISGNREAELTYLGLSDQVPDGVDCAIVDIGGGSTEAVVIRDDEIESQLSLPVGSGRLADRFFTQDPPGIDAVTAAILAAKDSVTELLGAPDPVGFVMLAGGSGLFMNQLIEAGSGSIPFGIDELRALSSRLAHQPAEQTVEMIGIPLARALVLPASVAIGVAILEILHSTEAVGVPSGIRMGLIREY